MAINGSIHMINWALCIYYTRYIWQSLSYLTCVIYWALWLNTLHNAHDQLGIKFIKQGKIRCSSTQATPDILIIYQQNMLSKSPLFYLKSAFIKINWRTKGRQIAQLHSICLYQFCYCGPHYFTCYMESLGRFLLTVRTRSKYYIFI